MEHVPDDDSDDVQDQDGAYLSEEGYIAAEPKDADGRQQEYQRDEYRSEHGCKYTKKPAVVCRLSIWYRILEFSEFLDHVVTSCYVMPGNGEVLQVAGGYAEAARAMSRALASAASEEPDGAPAEAGASAQTLAARQKKLSYKEQRELDALPDRIAAL